MRCFWAVAVVVVLAGCQTTTAKRADQNAAYAEFPAECMARPMFRESVTFELETKKEQPLAGLRFLMLKAESLDGTLANACMCKEGFVTPRVTEEGARKLLEAVIKGDGTAMGSFSLSGTEKMKTASYTASSDNWMGSFVGRGRAWFVGQCIQIVNGWSRPGREARAEAFLAEAAEAYGEVPLRRSAPVAATSMEQRLATLKDLADRKLITPAEYEAKRKEILGGL